MSSEFTKEELAKMAASEGIELSDDDLADVAGGKIDPAVWATMSIEERRAAQRDSLMQKRRGLPCALD